MNRVKAKIGWFFRPNVGNAYPGEDLEGAVNRCNLPGRR